MDGSVETNKSGVGEFVGAKVEVDNSVGTKVGVDNSVGTKV